MKSWLASKLFPGYVCIRVYRNKTSIGQLVSNQERRALVVLLVERGFCSSVGLKGISFMRSSEGTFRTGMFDALESARDNCLQGEPICRCPVLPGSATPRCHTVRSPDRTRLWCDLFLKSTSSMQMQCWMFHQHQ